MINAYMVIKLSEFLGTTTGYIIIIIMLCHQIYEKYT